MRRCIFLSIAIFLFTQIVAQSHWQHGRLKVGPDKYSLEYEDGTPFFWLGDTGWEIFSRLTLEEMITYFDNRSAKGFNVVQATVLSEHDLKRTNRYGDLPLQDFDPLKPNEKYFSVIDSAIALALDRNIFMALVATWGDKVEKLWGDGPVIFDSANAYQYGKWLGNRYKNFPNIIWILGGDRPPKTDTSNYIPVWRAMANGIIDATHHRCIITYHPSGWRSSSQWLHKETWLDFNMMQSSHGRHDAPNWDMIRKDRNYLPAKPTLDGEPNYEDHPVNPWPKWNVDSGYFRDYDVRKQLYRSVFAGGCGVTYGHHAIWQFLSEREEVVNYADRGWLLAMDRPGAYQAGYLRNLMESRPMQQRIPDSSIIEEGQSSINSEHMEAFKSADNSYGMVYLPAGRKITLNLQFIKGKKITAWWFNPKNNTMRKEGTFDRQDKMEFTPNATGTGNDWVLVIDDMDKGYKKP